MATLQPIQSWWIQIEGVPDRISFGEPSPEAFRRDHDDLCEEPASIADSCDPITAEVNLSSFNFRCNATDELVRLLLYQEVKARGILFNGITDSATAIFVEGGIALSQGDPIYIGSETLRVIEDLGGTPRGYTVGRGEWGSRALSFDAGEPVFFRVPRWRGRRIELFSRDTSRSPQSTLRWAGYVDRIKRSENGTRILVEARNLWTAAIETRGSRGNTGSSNVRLTAYNREDDPLRPILRGTATVSRPIPIPSGTAQNRFYAQIEEVVVACLIVQQFEKEVLVEINSPPLLGTQLEREVETGERFGGELRPIFLVSPIADDEWGDAAFDAGELFTSVGGRVVTPSTLAEWQSPFWAHPLQLAVFLLTGGIVNYSDGISYLGYAQGFTLDFRDLMGDGFAERVADLMRQAPELQVDHFLLGWDGREFDVIREVSEKLLRPYGYFFGVTQTGQPDIRRFGAMRVDEIEQIEAEGRVVTALPGPFVGEVDLSLENSVDLVTAKIGGLPWTDPREVAVEAVGGGSGRTRIGDGGRWDLDYSTVSKARAFDVIEELIRRSTLSAFSFPRLRVRVPDTEMGDLYDVGGVIRVDTLPVDGEYLLNRSGELVEFLDQNLETQLQFYGLILSRQFFPGPRTYELVIMLTSWRTAPIRLRGPSAVVLDFDDDFNEFTVEPSPFSSDGGNDVLAFEAFFDGSMTVLVDLCTPDLEVQETLTVDFFDSDASVIAVVEDPAFVTGGWIIRLSNYDSGYIFPNSGLVVYNFLSDDANLIDGDPAHEYA